MQTQKAASPRRGLKIILNSAKFPVDTGLAKSANAPVSEAIKQGSVDAVPLEGESGTKELKNTIPCVESEVPAKKPSRVTKKSLTCCKDYENNRVVKELPFDFHITDPEVFKSKFNLPSDWEVIAVKSPYVARNTDEVVVSPAMMRYGFSLLIDAEMAKLLVFLDIVPVQLSPAMLMVFDRVRLLERVFRPPFGFNELVRWIMPQEETVQGMIWHPLLFTDGRPFKGLPKCMPPTYPHLFKVTGQWNPTSYILRDTVRTCYSHPNRL